MWGEKQIQLGTLEEWKNKALNSGFEETLKGASLIVDSTDFSLTGKRSVSHKHESWSFKENSPARRFLIIMDSQREIKKTWGGYSPKVYDGSAIELLAFWIDNAFEGAGIVGDSHFYSCRKIFKKCKIFAAIPKTTKKKTKRRR